MSRSLICVKGVPWVLVWEEALQWQNCGYVEAMRSTFRPETRLLDIETIEDRMRCPTAASLDILCQLSQRHLDKSISFELLVLNTECFEHLKYLLLVFRCCVWPCCTAAKIFQSDLSFRPQAFSSGSAPPGVLLSRL